MPSQRSSNAAKNAKKKGRTAAMPATEPVVKAGALHDIAGVALIVIAIGMAIALLSPSSAVISAAANTALTLGFGVGAMLVPVSLLCYAVTYFVPTTGPVSTRVALGLTFIVLAILAMLSLTQAGVDLTPALVFDKQRLVEAGGYVGAALAWALLTLVGKNIGLVVLIGLIVVGVVICGFSISSVVAKAHDAAADRLGAHAEARAEKRASQRAERERKRGAQLAGTPEAAETSYIGSRKTTVLKRGKAADATTVLDEATPRKKKHPRLDSFEEDTAQGDAFEAYPEVEGSHLEPGVQLELDTSAAMTTRHDDGAIAPATTKLSRKRSTHAGSDERSEDAPSAEKPLVNGGRPVPPEGLEHLQVVTSEESRAAGELRSQDALAAEAGGAAAGAAGVAAAALEGVEGDAPTVVAPVKKRDIHRPGEESELYKLPPLKLLDKSPHAKTSSAAESELKQTAQRLQATLVEFGLSSKVVGWLAGPLVTTFKIEMGEGERVNKITNLEDDIALSLAAESVRIFAPIPGTSLVGIEIPNRRRQNVCLGDVLPYAQGGPLELAIGRDVEGRPVVQDLAKMPHLLIAGSTGSGKSVMINSIIMSILMRATPDQVRLIMIDPKRVELGGYNGLPHLYVPVVTEPRQANSALQWAVSEMERRLKLFERAHARDIGSYNKLVASGKLGEGEDAPAHMPYLVVIIDELSDLMMVAGKEVEASIVRIAQLARAAGIHLIVATQRPSADVVTGLIKSNIETRIAFSVASGTDSRVILDTVGAERLLGRGDMLFRSTGKRVKRVLGAYVSDPEIDAAVNFIRDQAEPDYHDEILSAVVPGAPAGGSSFDVAEDDDPLVWEAAQLVVSSQLGSTSGLQRRLKVGYARAGRIMDMLQEKGVVGPPDGSRPREVLLDEAGLEELRAAEAQYREV
jgi:S-DNA-T family DNA segregation ATPase FtsK/SpoIIIE